MLAFAYRLLLIVGRFGAQTDLLCISHSEVDMGPAFHFASAFYMSVF